MRGRVDRRPSARMGVGLAADINAASEEIAGHDVDIRAVGPHGTVNGIGNRQIPRRHGNKSERPALPGLH